MEKYKELLLESNILNTRDKTEFITFFKKMNQDEDFFIFIQSNLFVKLSLLQTVEYFININDNILTETKRKLLEM